MTDFFIADTHFFHDAVAAHRGFQTTEQHNRTIIDNIMRDTRPGDTIFFVGDVVGRTDDADAALDLIAHNIPDRTLRLIAGNHDPVHPMCSKAHKHTPDWLKVFDSIQSQTFIKMMGHKIPVSHFPYTGESSDRHLEDRHIQWRMRDLGTPIIHGHTHATDPVSTSDNGTIQICVSADAWNMKPVSKETLTATMSKYITTP